MYTACLLALGIWYEYGFDNEEIFALMAKWTIIHTIMVIATS